MNSEQEGNVASRSIKRIAADPRLSVLGASIEDTGGGNMAVAIPMPDFGECLVTYDEYAGWIIGLYDEEGMAGDVFRAGDPTEAARMAARLVQAA